MGTGVSDLGPLAGLLALRGLNCNGTLVSDLNPLKSLSKLEVLSCIQTRVADLSPLVGLPALKRVYYGGCPVTTIPAGLPVTDRENTHR